MLSGISRKRSIRSSTYWFTEFCNSQCLSHFAAPFIVVRAETSVAESCEFVFEWRATREGMEIQEERFKRNPAAGMALDKSSPTLLPSSFWAGNFSLPRTSQTRCTVVRLDACEWSFRRFTYGNLVTTSPSSKQFCSILNLSYIQL